MNLIRIDKLFNLKKGTLQSSKCVPGKYNFLTASAEWKTHNDYTYDCEALIFAAAASGSLGRTHYVNGKFISSDLCFIITPKDPVKCPVDLKFYHIIFNEFRNDIVKNTKAGTSKEAISLAAFGRYELPYLDIEEQKDIRVKFGKLEEMKEKISIEFLHQSLLLKKVRQSFLKEAMRGKLLGQNHSDEPANELLKKLKAEKDKLVDEKKHKKEKELPLKEEVPFAIPENWMWCRLNQICDNIIDCPHSTPKYLDIDSGYYGIDTNCINEDGQIIKLRALSKESYSERIKRLTPQMNDIVYSREGSIGLAAFIPPDKKICLGQRVLLFRPSKAVDHRFLKFAVIENEYKKRLLSKHRGMGAKHVNVRDIVLSLIALPPIPEQHRIVQKLEQLLSYCYELEKSLEQSKQYIELLIQKVLKEALKIGNNTNNLKCAKEKITVSN